MKNIKIFWWVLSIIWSPFEVLQKIFTKESTQVAIFIYNKIFDK